MQPDPLYSSQLLTQSGTDAWYELLSVARPAAIATVKHAGGTSADGEVFFQTAFAQASGQLPDNAPEDAVALITTLTEAHYRSWLQEHGQVQSSDVEANAGWLPADDELRAFRQKVFAWKRLRQLGPVCREKLIDDAPDKASCLQAFLVLLFPGTSNRPESLPTWVLDALADVSGYNNWLLIQFREDETPSSRLTAKPWIRVAFFVVLLLTGAWYVYKYFNGPVATEKVYASNFKPPVSLVEDMSMRHINDTVPPACVLLFEAADEHYRAGNLELAQEPLLLLVIDTSNETCHSDAWFYLGVVRLAMNDAQTAIECFAKIENLEAFGEDLYWYQGLAYVRLAFGDPSRRELARRAVERALANSTKPERKQQAAEMLKDLSE